MLRRCKLLRLSKWALSLLLAGGSLGALAVGAAAVPTITTNPTKGPAIASFTATATLADSCANVPPGTYYGFNFYWNADQAPFANPSVPCDPKMGAALPGRRSRLWSA